MSKRRQQVKGAHGRPLDADFLASVGGRSLTRMLGVKADDCDEAWGFGWKAPALRSAQEHAAAAMADAEMPRFSTPPRRKEPKAALLYETWTAPLVVEANGRAFSGIFQKTGSCLKGDAPVRMADGAERPIASLAVGDEVITHTGQARKVTDTFRREFTGDMVTLHVGGFAFPLTVTEDHAVAVMRGERHGRWQPDRLEWVKAGDVQEGDRVVVGWDRRPAAPKALDVAALLGDQAVLLDDLMTDGRRRGQGPPNVPVANLGMARHIVRRRGFDWRGRVKLVRGRTENALLRHVPVSSSLARFVGLYLAEGGCDDGRVAFTFHAKETALAGEVLSLARGLFGVEGRLEKPRKGALSLSVRFGNQALAAVLKALVPGNIYTKRVPGLFFGADEETKLALLLGWLHGDGHAVFKNGSLSIQGCSVSAGLARDMTVLALSCGIRASCHARKARGRSRECRIVHISGEKARALYPALAAKAQEAGVAVRQEDVYRCRFGYARKVIRVEREAVQSLPVYDIEVEEDHSFLSTDYTVHNCVGAGGGTCWNTLAFIEAVRLGDPELPLFVFWLLPYGRSRFYLGDRRPGEGSTGTTFAKAARDDGTLPASSPGLPQPQEDDGMLTWGRAAELSWSDGDAQQTIDNLPSSRKHLVKTTAKCSSADDVKAALQNGYPCTAASMYAHDGGRVQSDPPVLLGRKRGSWSHQMSVVAWMEHPKLGDLFWLMNQWGASAHGTCPTGAPRGGVWITAADMSWICRDEVYAFSQFDGFPAPGFDIPGIF